MTTAACTLLYILLLSLEDCECNTPPLPTKGVRLYVPFFNITLPNNSMLPADYFYYEDKNNDNIIDALWCQSSNNITNNGVWYYPNGSSVFEEGILYTNKSVNSQVGLYRRSSLQKAEGIYKCVIADENNINQTLLVGLYRTVTYNTSTGPVVSPNEFNKILSCDDNQFNVTFTIENGTATYINCSVNVKPTTIHQTILSYELPTNISVLMIFNSSKEGLYNCTVSNFRVEDRRGKILRASPAVIHVNVSKLLNCPRSTTSTMDSIPSTTYDHALVSPSTSPSSSSSPTDNNTGLYYLVVVGLLFIIVVISTIIVFVVILLRILKRRKNGKKNNVNDNEEHIKQQNLFTSDTTKLSFDHDSSMYYSKATAFDEDSDQYYSKANECTYITESEIDNKEIYSTIKEEIADYKEIEKECKYQSKFEMETYSTINKDVNDTLNIQEDSHVFSDDNIVKETAAVPTENESYIYATVNK